MTDKRFWPDKRIEKHEKRIEELERQRDEYRHLLAEALEYIQDPDWSSPFERALFECKIDDAINPEEV